MIFEFIILLFLLNHELIVSFKSPKYLHVANRFYEKFGDSLAIDSLPELSSVDLSNLLHNRRVQNQKRVGRDGRGWVVLDIKAPLTDVFSNLKMFHKYPQMIPTVRTAEIQTINNSTFKAAYTLSRFRLPVKVIHGIDENQKRITFAIDPSKPNPVISKCQGYWLVQELEDKATTRVWLFANIVVSRLVPTFIVDYAAARALPRATEWLFTYFR